MALGWGALCALNYKHHRAIANPSAIAFRATYGLRFAVGREDSNARQS
jgi:hypothetical protein